MTTFVFRLSRLDGRQHLGELLNVTIKANSYADAAMIITDKYPDYYIVGNTVM